MPGRGNALPDGDSMGANPTSLAASYLLVKRIAWRAVPCYSSSILTMTGWSVGSRVCGMAAEYDDRDLFARLFEEEALTPQLIYDQVTDIQFEFFIAYVFEQAGYRVEHTGYQHGPGLDLKVSIGLTSGQSLHAGVQVKHFQPGVTKVTAPQVVSLRGGLPQLSDVTGYFVTTSTFNDPALVEAQHGRRIWPIDGEHLVRYITYLRGSRAVRKDDVDPDRTLHSNPIAPIAPDVFFTADKIEQRPVKSTAVLTLANNRGGVGKTTSALNIALGLAALDQQVLLIDLDAQANLTRSLPPQAPSATPVHIGEYFTLKKTLAELIRPTQFKRVWLIPSDGALSHSDMGNAAGPGVELRFERDLHAKEIAPPQVLDARPFDWIIIDTSPHMGLFTSSALAASHFVIVPVSPSVFADQGTNLLTETVHTMAALTGWPIDILGILVTQWKEDAVNKDLLAKFTNRVAPSGLELLKTRIPLDKSNIEKAHIETGQGKKKSLFDRKSAAAQAYTAVVDEVFHYGRS